MLDSHGVNSRAFLSHLCAVSAIALLMAAPISTANAQVATETVASQLTNISTLADDQFLTELGRLQQAAPENAQALANAAKSLRPHLAARIDQLLAAAMGPNFALAVALGVGVGTAAAITVAQSQGKRTQTVETILPPLQPGWDTDEAVWETAEYLIDYSKPGINASAAYARGGTGAGMMVGVFDTGLFGDHADIIANVAGCYKTLTGEHSLDTTHCEDGHGHGSHVSGTIAATRDNYAMHGVAFDAKVLNVNITNASGGLGPSASEYANAMQWVVDNGAMVSNHSYGQPKRHDQLNEQNYDALLGVFGGAFEIAARNNHILVWANGNEHFDEPGPEAALPLYEPDLLPNWVAVTSINQDGTRSSYANACGMAAAWCISAPGGDTGQLIVSLAPAPDAYQDMGGTSMAAPQVTGALAILLQLFGPGTVSNLTPQQIVQVMFKTADKDLPGYENTLDINGLSKIYGHGALDLDAATTPAKHTMSLAGYAVLRSGFGVDGAIGGTLSARLSEQSLAVFDHLGRGITINLGQFTAQTGSNFDYQDAYRRLGQSGAETVELASGLTLTFTPAETGAFDPKRSEIQIRTELAEGTHLLAGANTSPEYALGFFSESDFGPTALVDASALSVPYLGLAEQATMSGLQSELGQGDLTVFAFGGAAKAAEGAAPAAAAEELASWNYGAAAEWSTAFGDALGLAVRGGVVAETRDLLGSKFSGAFSLDGTTTGFVGAGLRFELTPDLELVGSYDIGLSNVATAAGSLIARVDPLISDAFSLGLIGKNGLINEDRFGIVVSQPMRVSNGAAVIELPQARNDDGSLAYRDASIDLAATGQELRLQGFYMTPAMGGQLALGAMLRFEPGHVAGSATDVAGMASFKRAY